MEVKMFNKETDYEEICDWWRSWGLPVHPKEILSETGITISRGGVNICSSFIYSTDSYIRVTLVTIHCYCCHTNYDPLNYMNTELPQNNSNRL